MGNVGYRDLQVYVLARELAVEIHQMTLTLPKYEMYEEGSQIRRSSKSIVANIVEGFSRRRYKNEFLHSAIIAMAECDETQVHLEMLFETGSLKNKEKYLHLREEYHKLAKMLNRFTSSIKANHMSDK